ncbi:MAG: DUF1963 domain-containing protein [Planctomycetes bacterium]|nr:DUF1963 domain-containing protein [Planctomycetota bacterium]
MVNYEFRLEEWLDRLPLDDEYARSCGRFSGTEITSPSDICINERLRAEVREQVDWGPAVPVDVFVMATGEPRDRHVTKIGGLPYRPASKPWPKSQDRQPMTFLAQFCFADSKDLVGDLPGEVLLVFASPEGPSGSSALDLAKLSESLPSRQPGSLPPELLEDLPSGFLEDVTSEIVERLRVVQSEDRGPRSSEFYPGGLEFEWYDLGLTHPMPASTVPKQPLRFHPSYGHICRIISFPEAKRKPAFESDDRYLTCRGLDVWSEYYLMQYQATQIGAAPFYIHNYDLEVIGRPLCVINSTVPALDQPYPWVNHPEPLHPRGEWESSALENYLVFGDAGCIYISIDDADSLHFDLQYY